MNCFYTYYIDRPNTKRIGNQNIWSAVSFDENGDLFQNDHEASKMYIGYPFVSAPLISKETDEDKREGSLVRKGPLKIDIDSGKTESVGVALKLIDHFGEVFNVDPLLWQVFLSGSKGVHMELSDMVMGTEGGSTVLPLAYKELAKKVSGEINMDIDMSMYNMGCPKPFRQKNVLRENGLKKVIVSVNELYEIITEEDYIGKCSESPCQRDEAVKEDADIRKRLLRNASKHAHLLADLVAELLAEADDKHKKILVNKRNKKPVKFNGEIPGCVRAMSSLSQRPEGLTATFNDIAIQLTGYFLSAGIPAESAIQICGQFLYNYPSSSLDTPEKREINFLNRYRSMAQRGSVVSCNAIKSLKISGYSCSICSIAQEECCKDNVKEVMQNSTCSIDETAASSCTAVREETEDKSSVLTTETADDISICLDGLLDSSGGLIKLGLEALGSKGLPPIPAYNLPTVLSMIAAAVSGKITIAGIWPSLYHCKIGRSSSGKSASSEAAYRAISSINPSFFGPSSFSSGQAFLTYMSDNPHSISILDEVEWMFRGGGGGKESGSYNDDDRKSILMELHTKAGVKKYPKFYADKKKSIEISTPCLNVLGSTTVLVMDRISESDFSSGFIPRWEFFCYVGEDVQRGFSLHPESNSRLVDFAEKICTLKEVRPRGGGSLGKYIGDFYTTALDMTDECSELMDLISRETVNDVNKASDEYARPVLSRRFDAVLKYAMLHHVSVKYKEGVNDGHGIFDPIEIESVQWAKKLTDKLAFWKIEKMLNSIPAGSFYKDCELFESAVKMCEKSNRRGTMQALQNRKRAMKNWEPSYFDKVVLTLKNSGKIDVVFHEGKQVYVSAVNLE